MKQHEVSLSGFQTGLILSESLAQRGVNGTLRRPREEVASREVSAKQAAESTRGSIIQSYATV